MTERLVVVGGDAAGMTAASQARKRRGPGDLEILAFERGAYTSYSACGIPYFIGDTVKDLDALIVRTPEEFKTKHDIDVRIRHEVVGIDIDGRRVTVRDLERDREFEEPFDQLMVATGAVPVRPDLENVDAEGIFGVQVLGDGVAIRRLIDEEKPQRAVVDSRGLHRYRDGRGAAATRHRRDGGRACSGTVVFPRSRYGSSRFGGDPRPRYHALYR